MVEQQLRDVGLAEDDRPGGANTRDPGIVLRGEDIGARSEAEGGGRAGEVEVFLDGDGHAVQWTQRLATGALLVGGLRLGARLVVALDDDGVERAIHLLDACDVRLHRLGCRDLTSRDGCGQLARAHLDQRLVRPRAHTLHSPANRHGKPHHRMGAIECAPTAWINCHETRLRLRDLTHDGQGSVYVLGGDAIMRHCADAPVVAARE